MILILLSWEIYYVQYICIYIIFYCPVCTYGKAYNCGDDFRITEFVRDRLVNIANIFLFEILKHYKALSYYTSLFAISDVPDTFNDTFNDTRVRGILPFQKSSHPSALFFIYSVGFRYIYTRGRFPTKSPDATSKEGIHYPLAVGQGNRSMPGTSSF